MRHPQTDVQQETRVLSTLNGHQRRSDLTLVSKVSLVVVGVISVEVVQEEAEEDMVVVQMPFSEAKGTYYTEDSPAAQNMTMIH